MTCTLLPRSAWILRHSYQKRHYSSLTWTRDAFVRQCLFTLHKQTNEPIWRFLAVLGHPRVEEAVGKAYIPEGYKRLALALPSLTSTTAARDNYDEIQNTQNVDDTLAALNLPQKQLNTLRTWIHIYTLFANHSHSPSRTLAHIVDPLFASLEDLPTYHQAPLLIFGAAHLSTWNLVLPLGKVVEEFVSLPHPIETPIRSSRGRVQVSNRLQKTPNDNSKATHTPIGGHGILTLPDTPTRPISELHFNLFLRALALVPKYSTSYDRYVRQVLHRMDTLPRPTITKNETGGAQANPSQTGVVIPDSQGSEEDTVTLPHTLHPDTYTCLLLSTHNVLLTPGRVPHQASLLSPPLATYLASRLLKEPGIEMNDTHREALLRFWRKEATQGGARGERGKTHARELWLEAQAKGGREPQEVEDTLGIVSPSKERNDSALEKAEKGGTTTKGEVESDPVLRANTLYLGAQSSVRGVRELLKIFNSASPDNADPGAQRQLKSKSTLDAYDLTSTLMGAANDASVSLPLFQATFRKLLQAYKAPSSASIESIVPLAAHTAYLKGLYWRHAFEEARMWWDAEVWEKSNWNTGARPTQKGLYVLDKKAITIGVQILARCGRSKEAIELLQKVSWKPAGSPTFAARLPKPIALTSISLLDILVSFKRADRPDIVFSLWEHMYTLFSVVPTSEILNVLLQSARMAVVMESNSFKAHVRGAINVGKEKLRLSPRTGRVLGQAGERERERERALEELLDVAGRSQYEGGRLWRGKRVEEAAREVFLQAMFGMDVGYGAARPMDAKELQSAGGGSSGSKKVGLANVIAPACSVRPDWDSDAGVVGLGVGLPELRLKRFSYQPGPEMFAWVPVLAHPSPNQSHANDTPKVVARPLYPSLSLTNTNFLAYFSLLAVTRRTSEVALALAWMRELGVNPSESVLALACALWEEVSAEGPLVDLVVSKLDGQRKKSTNTKRPEPRDEYERLIFWIEDWVGRERVPGIEALRKWRSVVRDMREPEVRAALVRQRKMLREEKRLEKASQKKQLQRVEAKIAERQERWRKMEEEKRGEYREHREYREY